MQYEDIASVKASKYLLITLALVVILAATGWLLRNSIIQRLSGPILAQYGLSISRVSLDALATRNASISFLELEHENGTIIAIEDLILPISTSATVRASTQLSSGFTLPRHRSTGFGSATHD